MKLRNILIIGSLILSNNLIAKDFNEYKKSDIKKITNICLNVNENYKSNQYKQCFIDGIKFLDKSEERKIYFKRLKKYEIHVDNYISNLCLGVYKNPTKEKFKQCYLKNKIIFNTEVLKRMKKIK